MPAAVTLRGAGRGSPPHSSLEAGQMLLLDSRMLWQDGGALGDSARQEMGAGARSRTKSSGASLCACLGPPALLQLGVCPFLPSVTHSLPLPALRGTGTRQDPLPASGPLPLRVSLSPGRPWAWTLCEDRPCCCSGGAGRHSGYQTSAPASSLHPEDLPQHCTHCGCCPSLLRDSRGGISLIFLNKRKFYLSLRARISFPAVCTLGLWKASPGSWGTAGPALSLPRGHVVLSSARSLLGFHWG